MIDADSLAASAGGVPEIHLFLLWGAALAEADAIYDDLEQHFDLVDSALVRWSPERFERNLARLYGTSARRTAEKAASVGLDPFHVLVVRDPAPSYGARSRSWGIGAANVATYDAKARYRAWAGGEFRVHATVDRREAERDVFMLLGRRIEEYANAEPLPWRRDPPRQAGDVVGEGGWDSLEQLLHALGLCLRCVVLRRGAAPSGEAALTLLVDERERAAVVAAGPEARRASALECLVEGRGVSIELREVGDGTLDPEWQRALLRDPVRLADGSLVPRGEGGAYAQLYELVAHTPADERAAAALRTVVRAALPPGDYADPNFARAMLDEYLLRSGYDYAVPSARHVLPNPAVLGRGPRFRRFVRRRSPLLARLGARLLRLAARGRGRSVVMRTS